MSLPKIVKDFNLFLDALGFAGLAKTVTLPKLALKTEDYEAGGMGGPVKIDLGLEGLKLEFTLGEFSAPVLKNWGVANPSGINARFLGAAVAQDGSGVDAIEISVRGRWESLDLGTVEKKKLTEMKVEMPLTYFRYSVNSEVLIEIDLISGKQVVNGTDLTSAILSALSITA